jgi:RecB family exonuclease
MLRRYLSHPLAGATTLGVEYEFNLQLPTARVRGIVDRLCELDGGAVLVDYKTNHRLDERLRQAYFTQLRLYGAAAEKGLLPARDPRLVLFDLRRGEAIEVPPDAAAVTARVEAVAARISAGDYSLGPEHANRPCALCAYRPICKDAR